MAVQRGSGSASGVLTRAATLTAQAIRCHAVYPPVMGKAGWCAAMSLAEDGPSVLLACFISPIRLTPVDHISSDS